MRCCHRGPCVPPSYLFSVPVLSPVRRASSSRLSPAAARHERSRSPNGASGRRARQGRQSTFTASGGVAPAGEADPPHTRQVSERDCARSMARRSCPTRCRVTPNRRPISAGTNPWARRRATSCLRHSFGCLPLPNPPIALPSTPDHPPLNRFTRRPSRRAGAGAATGASPRTGTAPRTARTGRRRSARSVSDRSAAQNATPTPEKRARMLATADGGARHGAGARRCARDVMPPRSGRGAGRVEDAGRERGGVERAVFHEAGPRLRGHRRRHRGQPAPLGRNRSREGRRGDWLRDGGAARAVGAVTRLVRRRRRGQLGLVRGMGPVGGVIPPRHDVIAAAGAGHGRRAP
jgi:hypothetical protein